MIDTLKPYDRVHSPPDLPDVLGQAIHSASLALRNRIEIDPDAATMGTTLVAMLWSGTTVIVANIGDSRAYLLRDGDLTQISEDHTYGNLVADAADVPNLPEKIARFLDGRADGRSPDLSLATAPLGRSICAVLGRLERRRAHRSYAGCSGLDH
ncbi:PP2C family protein-serine/threonine phosphatase [Nonomuraea ferruginea]